MAEVDLRKAKGSVGGGHGDVAGGDDREGAAEAPAVDRRDGRAREVAQLLVAPGVRDAAVLLAATAVVAVFVEVLFEILAGAKASPLPVMTSTWVASSVARSLSASYISQCNCGLIALRFSGRLSRMVVTPSWLSTRMVEYSATMPSLRAADRWRGEAILAHRPGRSLSADAPPRLAARGPLHWGQTSSSGVTDLVSTTPPASPARPPAAERAGGASFASLRHPAYRAYCYTSMGSMLGDNIEHVITYWVLWQTFTRR